MPFTVAPPAPDNRPMSNTETKRSSSINSVVMLGNYLPRKCGIATFTTDLANAVDTTFADMDVRTLAMNDREEGYDYPQAVVFELKEDCLADYKQAAEYLLENRPDVVCVQHEYGIFGGNGGDYLLTLLEGIDIPVVVTLHTVLTEPNPDHLRVMSRLDTLANRFVVMSHKAHSILHQTYHIAKHKITYIPHGIPDTPFVDPNYYKDQFDAMGRKLLLTFGLLSPNKGIEYAIKALPKVVAQHPDVLYIVLGATHPNIVRDVGEVYRDSLKELVKELGIERNVKFCDQFVDFDSLCEYLSAADVYVTPYVNAAQITSGTLAYAMGTGKPVVSTPYWYAEEMLAEQRGCLVPFKDADAIADGILAYLNDEELQHSTRKRAYDYTRMARWSEVAASYVTLFETLVEEQTARPGALTVDYKTITQQSTQLVEEGPGIKHLVALSDSVGLFQHAWHMIADRKHGYCIDDNVRAMLVVSDLLSAAYERSKSARYNAHTTKDIQHLEETLSTYLSFIADAYNETTHRFRNFMSYDRQWLEESGSEDSQARTIWCTAYALNKLRNTRFRGILCELFHKSMDAADSLSSIRSQAFMILGLKEYLAIYPGDSSAKRLLRGLAESIHHRFLDAQTDENWLWPEDILAYDNPRLPQALIAASTILKDDAMLNTGLNVLAWLVRIQTKNDCFSAIGCHGWYVRGESKARFDQQPLEAAAMLAACRQAIEALLLESNNKQDELGSSEQTKAEYRSIGTWLSHARMSHEWFLGRNELGVSLYDSESQGCFDGISPRGANKNQGAESTLAWMQANIDMQAVRRLKHLGSQSVATEKTSMSAITPMVEHLNPEDSEVQNVALLAKANLVSTRREDSIR